MGSSYTTEDAEGRFAELVGRASQGETITITYGSATVATITPPPADDDAARTDGRR
jgi:antitoxin (DNA-binding transcriptional repressor) of toxin-antitoxin stability system